MRLVGTGNKQNSIHQTPYTITKTNFKILFVTKVLNTVLTLSSYSITHIPIHFTQRQFHC